MPQIHKEAPTKSSRFDASAGAFRCQNHGHPLAGNLNRSFSGLWLQTNHISLVETDTTCPISNPLARPLLTDQWPWSSTMNQNGNATAQPCGQAPTNQEATVNVLAISKNRAFLTDILFVDATILFQASRISAE